MRRTRRCLKRSSAAPQSNPCDAQRQKARALLGALRTAGVQFGGAPAGGRGGLLVCNAGTPAVSQPRPNPVRCSELTKRQHADFYERLQRRPEHLSKGESHRHLLSSLHDLARLQHARGELGAASEAMGLAVCGACATVGKEHPHSLSSAHQLAMIRMSQGLQVVM